MSIVRSFQSIYSESLVSDETLSYQGQFQIEEQEKKRVDIELPPCQSVLNQIKAQDFMARDTGSKQESVRPSDE